MNPHPVTFLQMECGRNHSDPIREEMQQQMKTSGLEVKPKEAILVTLAFVLLVYSGEKVIERGEKSLLIKARLKFCYL